jgi:hypothetical protein
MPSDNYREVELVDWPGWVRIVEGKNRRYRSPSGVEISNNQLSKLARQYTDTHSIPESLVATASGINTATDSLKSKPAFMTDATAPKQVPHPDPGAQRLAAAQVQVDEPEKETTSFRDNIVDIGERTGVTGKNPKGTRTDRRYKKQHPRATAAGLGQGIRKLLMLITTLIVAKILNDERAGMTDQEATLLGSALGNLLEPTPFNENWGWIIADTGDYQAIGYVLIMYGSRINDIVQEKRQYAQQQQPASPGMPPPMPPNSQNGARPQQPQPGTPGTPGSYLMPSSNLKTPPGLHLGGNQ